MPKILVNYIYNKEKDNFTIIEDSVVYADMPVAIKERFSKFEENYVVPINGKNIVVDKNEFFSINRLYKLKLVEENKVEESEDGEIKVYLPKTGFNVSDLRYLNGKIYLSNENGG